MTVLYKDLLKKVKRQMTEITGNGYSLTPAFVKEENGHKCEVYFAYNLSGKGDITRPYIRLVTDYGTGIILEYRNAHYCEFANADKFPLDGKMSPKVPIAKSAAEQAELLNKLLSLYESVREFALSEDISDEERKTLAEYRQCLYDTIPAELMAFCVDAEKDFFEWIDKSIFP